MSVKHFIDTLFESGIDFSNTDIDDFILSVKTLARLLTPSTSDSRKAVRSRKFNSLLSKEVYLSERFNPKTVHDYYHFTDMNVQIDIIIKNRVFGVSFIGLSPSVSEFIKVYNIETNRDLFSFDFLDFDNFQKYLSSSSNVSFFLGDSDNFGLNEVGLRHIIQVWRVWIISYLRGNVRQSSTL